MIDTHHRLPLDHHHHHHLGEVGAAGRERTPWHRGGLLLPRDVEEELMVLERMVAWQARFDQLRLQNKR